MQLDGLLDFMSGRDRRKRRQQRPPSKDAYDPWEWEESGIRWKENKIRQARRSGKGKCEEDG